MKKTKALSILLILSLMLGICSFSAYAEGEEIESEEPEIIELHISTPEQLREFAINCKLDSFSANLAVYLDKDIDLSSHPFDPIGNFRGTFYGCDHTISGLTLSTDGSYQGLFRFIREGAVVSDLNVAGSIEPKTQKESVGGIAGANYGTIINCTFTGQVTGNESIGGIVGYNYGAVSRCEVNGHIAGKTAVGGIAGSNSGYLSENTNHAVVNDTIPESTLTVEDLNNVDLTNFNLVSAEDSEAVSDVGGIVGYSDGVVIGCINDGSIGYQNYGYNIGGIVGRQANFVKDCINNGSVLGRRDVGGIVGQMEPYLIKTQMESLVDELTNLTKSLNTAMAHLGSNSGQASTVVSGMEADASAAAANATTIDKNQEDPVLPSNKEEEEKTDDDTSFTEKVQDKTDSAGEYIEGAAGGLNEDTKDDITSGNIGNLTDEEKDNLTDVGSGVIGDASGAIGDRIDQRKEEEAAKERETNLAYQNLNGNLNSLRKGLTELNRILAKSMGEMAVDMTDVNNHFYKVSTLFASLLSGDIIEYSDISMYDTEDATLGKVSGCVNNGSVEGESNIGGIGGNMGIEVSLDLEGNLTDRLSNMKLVRNSYEERCIARACKNYGTVNGKKTNIGGIVGYQEIGAVLSCEGYGTIGNGNETYVGGIVGYSKAFIANCSAMCDLEAKEYAGGIVGYGYKINHCTSLINLLSNCASCGTIAGWADTALYESETNDKGEEISRTYYVSDNVFVHDTMGGIDNLSYESAACPIDYETLISLENSPEELRRMELTYIADGEIVAVVPFMYGTALDTTLIPEVPEKEGYSGYWPEYDYSMLYFSDTLEATYISNQTTLASTLMRDENKMSIVLLEGSFSDRAALSLEEYTRGVPSLPEKNFKVLETWQVRITGNHFDNNSYVVRFLPPESAPFTSTGIYVLGDDGTWTLVKTNEKGSYLTFDGNDDSLVFAFFEMKEYAPIYTAAAVAGILLLLAVFFLLRRRKAAKSAITVDPGDMIPASEQEPASGTDEETSVPSDANAEDSKEEGEPSPMDNDALPEEEVPSEELSQPSEPEADEESSEESTEICEEAQGAEEPLSAAGEEPAAAENDSISNVEACSEADNAVPSETAEAEVSEPIMEEETNSASEEGIPSEPSAAPKQPHKRKRNRK